MLESLLQGGELVLIIWAAAPHVLSLVARMRAVTHQLSSEVQHGVQRPTKVLPRQQILCLLCMDGLLAQDRPDSSLIGHICCACWSCGS